MNGNFAKDRRWNLGGYILKQNPNSDTKSMKVVAQPKMNIHGKMQSTKEGYQKSRSFTFDVYEKRTAISNIKKQFTDKTYLSIGYDMATEKIYGLNNEGSIDIYNYDGDFIEEKTIDKSNYAKNSTVTDELNINPMSLIDGDVNTYWRSDASTPVHTATIGLGSLKKVSYVDIYIKSGRSAVIEVELRKPGTTTSITKNITTNMSGLISIPLLGEVRDCDTILLTVTHNDANRDLISQIYFGYEPVGTPISMTHIGMGEFAVLYSYVSDIETPMQELIIYDENMSENRKYIYSSGLPELKKITWNIDQYIVALGVDTIFFEISKNSGAYNFKGNPPNAGHYINANDIFVIKKLNSKFIGILLNDKIEFLNYLTLERVDLAKPPVKLDCIYFNDTLQEYIAIEGRSLRKINVNTSRLDILTIKTLCLMGKIILYDEFGFPFSLIIEDIDIQRLRNMDESRWSITVSALVAYENQGFKHGYYGEYVHPGDNM